MSKKWRNRFLSFYHSMLAFNWQPFWNYTFTGIYPPMPLLFYLLEFFQTWINSWHACKLKKKLVWPERDLREFRFSNSLKYLLWVIWHTWNIFYCYFFHQIKPTKCECATPLLTKYRLMDMFWDTHSLRKSKVSYVSCRRGSMISYPGPESTKYCIIVIYIVWYQSINSCQRIIHLLLGLP